MSGVARQRKVIIAAALVAVTALLVGFHGVTTYLSAVSLSGQAERANGAANVQQRNADPVKSPEPSAAASPATRLEMPAPTGVAAAAKAKAQEEVTALEQQPARESQPSNASRYRRSPNVDLHRVY